METLQHPSSFENGLHSLVGQLVDSVQDSLRQGTPLHHIELSIWKQLLTLGRQVLQLVFDTLGPADMGDSVETSQGNTLRKLPELHSRRYVSLFGTFELQRVAYGTREGQQIEFVPLDNRLGLPESAYSYLLQDWSQLLCVESAFGHVSQTLLRIFDHKIGVAALQAINEKMATKVDSFRNNRPAPQADSEAEVMVATADGKGIVMRRDATDPPAPAHRSKGEKASKKRMAMVASVYSVDRHVRDADDIVAALFRDPRREEEPAAERPRPQNKRVMASLAKQEESKRVSAVDIVHKWMRNELVERNRQGGQWQKEMVVLYDGQESLWEARDGYLPSQAVEILDLLHVTPRLWQAAHLFCAEKSREATEFVRERCRRILEGNVVGVVKGLRRLGTVRGLRGNAKKSLKTLCGYLEKNRSRMRYDEYLEKGYPIASGVIEGACRHLVKDRMERAGMHWKPPGAQAMLDVRGVQIEGSWEEYQTYRIEKEQRKLYPHRHLVVGKQYDIAL